MTQLRSNIDSISVKLPESIFAEIESIKRDYPVPYWSEKEQTVLKNAFRDMRKTDACLELICY